MENDQNQTVSRADFARRMNVTTRTLRRWTKHGYGPQPVRIGGQGPGIHTVYDKAEVDAFVAELAGQSVEQGRRRAAVA